MNSTSFQPKRLDPTLPVHPKFSYLKFSSAALLMKSLCSCCFLHQIVSGTQQGPQFCLLLHVFFISLKHRYVQHQFCTWSSYFNSQKRTIKLWRWKTCSSRIFAILVASIPKISSCLLVKSSSCSSFFND